MKKLFKIIACGLLCGVIGFLISWYSTLAIQIQQIYFFNLATAKAYTIECFSDDACRQVVWATSDGEQGNQFRERFSADDSKYLPFYISTQDTYVWVNSNILIYNKELHKFYSDRFVSKKIDECLIIRECKVAYKDAHGLTQKQVVLNKYVGLGSKYIVVQYIQPSKNQLTK